METKKIREAHFSLALCPLDLRDLAAKGVDINDHHAVTVACTIGPESRGDLGISLPVVARRDDGCGNHNLEFVDVEWTDDGPVAQVDSHRFLRLLGSSIDEAQKSDDRALRKLSNGYGATAEDAARLLRMWREEDGRPMSQIINLTPHPIHLCLGNDDTVTVTIPRMTESGARVTENSERVGEIVHEGHSVPDYSVEYGSIEGLPPPVHDGVVYVVSIIVARAAAAFGWTTEDLRVPHGLVRDSSGRIVGCRGLARV
jgi:hypothetical protein